MPDQRIDALAGHPRRERTFAGRVLDHDVDQTLQALVEEAARALGTPIALVSMVLDRIQYFQAHHGLPAELATVRATSRDTSFCQFVVRDGAPVRIGDAAGDPTLPQGLVAAYGIRSYLGVPIHLDGQALGSLCVVDTEPRDFDDAEVATLVEIAARVDQRLAELAADRAGRPLPMIRDAVSPVFADLRNQLIPLQFGAEEVRIAAFELTAFVTAVQMGADRPYLMRNLADTVAATARLRESADMIQGAAARVLSNIEALERAASHTWDRPSARDVVDTASALAAHMTRTLGGVEWEIVGGESVVLLPLPIASAALASVLNWLVQRLRGRSAGPLRGRVARAGRDVLVELTADGLDAGDVEAMRLRLAESGLDGRLIRVEGDGATVRVRLPAG